MCVCVCVCAPCSVEAIHQRCKGTTQGSSSCKDRASRGGGSAGPRPAAPRQPRSACVVKKEAPPLARDVVRACVRACCARCAPHYSTAIEAVPIEACPERRGNLGAYRHGHGMHGHVVYSWRYVHLSPGSQCVLAGRPVRVSYARACAGLGWSAHVMAGRSGRRTWTEATGEGEGGDRSSIEAKGWGGVLGAAEGVAGWTSEAPFLSRGHRQQTQRAAGDV